MILLSVLALTLLFMFCHKCCTRVLSNDLGLSYKLARDFSFIFFMFEIVTGAIFKLYLPSVPDNEMFSSIVKTRELVLAHAGNFDLVGFWFFSYPVSIILQGNDHLYLIFQKIIFATSIIILFCGVTNSIYHGVNDACSRKYFPALMVFILFVIIYPSAFVHYNNILRESFELFFFALFVFFIEKKRVIIAFLLFCALVFVRFDSVIYIPFIFLYSFFRVKNFNGKQADYIIAIFCVLFFLVLFSPPVFEYLINRRTAKFIFFYDLGIPANTLFDNPARMEYSEFYKFYAYSIFQYIFDPISLKVFNGTLFMWLESGFSVLVFLFLSLFSIARLRVSRVVIVCVCLIFLQACVEYYIQGGMRHRLLPYLVLLVVFSHEQNNIKRLES